MYKRQHIRVIRFLLYVGGRPWIAQSYASFDVLVFEYIKGIKGHSGHEGHNIATPNDSFISVNTNSKARSS